MSVEVAEVALRIEPSAEVRGYLARSIASFGAVVRGQYQFEWIEDRPNGPCICITQKNVRGKTSVCIEIRNPDDTPRQANHDDVNDFRRQLHRRLEKADWVKEHYAAKDEARAKAKADRRDLAEQTVKEFIRVMKAPVTIDYGAIRPPDEPSENGYKVIDRRHKYEDAP